MKRFLKLWLACAIPTPAAVQHIAGVDLLYAALLHVTAMLLEIALSQGGSLLREDGGMVFPLWVAVTSGLVAMPGLVLKAMNAAAESYADTQMPFVGTSLLSLAGVIGSHAGVFPPPFEYVLVASYFFVFLLAFLFHLVSRSPEEIIRQSAEPSHEVVRSMRAEKVVDLGPSIGTIADRSIPAWIKLSSGRTLYYKSYLGAEIDLERLRPGEVVIAPGLLYADAEPPAQADAAGGTKV